jgi:Uncharacterized conserved protein, contains S4-like domain
MQNNYFIHNMKEKISKGDFTYFLNSKEASDLKGFLNKEGIKYNVLDLYKDSDKVIIYNKKLPKLKLYEIVSERELTHPKILGSLFSYGINQNMFGDVLVIDNKTYIILLKKFDKQIIKLVTEINNSIVKYKECNTAILKTFEREYEERKVMVKSLRFDMVLARLLHKSRKQIDKLFQDKLILLNYNEKVKKEVLLRIHDVFSVRKYGKYQIKIIENKKNRFEIYLNKYK